MSYSAPYTKAVLIVGQSNQVGVNRVTLDLQNTHNDAKIDFWSRAGTAPTWEHISDGWETLHSFQLGNSSDRAFLRRLADLGHNHVGLKFASNGKPLAAYFRKGYEGWGHLTQAIDDAIAEWPSDRPPLRIMGLYWVQGQDDAVRGQAVAEAYAANMKEFIWDLRQYVGNYAMWFVSPAHPPSWASTEYGATVRAQIIQFCGSDSFAAPAFDVSDTETRDGGTHYEVSSFELMGNRGAETASEHLRL